MFYCCKYVILCVLWKLTNSGLCFQSYLNRLIREDTERQIEKLRQENSNNEYQIQDEVIELEQQCVCNFYFLYVHIVAWETFRAKMNTMTLQQKLNQVLTCPQLTHHIQWQNRPAFYSFAVSLAGMIGSTGKHHFSRVLEWQQLWTFETGTLHMICILLWNVIQNIC